MSTVYSLLTTRPQSGSDLASDLVGEYQESIFVRNAKGMNVGSTLFGLMSRLKSEAAENTVYNWFERDPATREIAIGAAGADGTPPAAFEEDDTIVVATNHWKYLDVGTVIYVPRTGEYMRVRTQPTTTSVAVDRAINASVEGEPAAGTPSTSYTLANDEPLVIVTLGKHEGADPVRAFYEEPELISNYIQTFNRSVTLSNAFKANKLRSDAAGPLRQRRIYALEHIAKDIEMAFLFGWRRKIYDGTEANGYTYYTGGLKHAVDSYAPANVLDGNDSAGVSLTDFNDWLATFMTVGSDAKLALCGPTAYATVSNYANSAVNGFRIMNQETVFGMNITVVNTPFGVLNLAFHPLLKEIPTYTDWMFVCDLAHIIQKTMEPLFLEPNIQTPGQDSYKEQFRAKLGLKLRFAEAFGYAYDLSKIN